MREAHEEGGGLQAILNDLITEDAPWDPDAIRRLPLSDPEMKSSLLAFVLWKLRGDPSPRIRAYAAFVLGEIGDPTAVPGLMEALGDRDVWPRDQAAQSLGNLKDVRAVPCLLEALRHSDAVTRDAAASAVAAINDPVAVPGLLEALHSPIVDIPYLAGWVLTKIGSPSAIPGLLQKLRSLEERVRWYAALVLGSIGDANAAPGLLDALEHEKDDHVRREICWSLGKISARARAVLEAVVPVLSVVAEADPSSSVQTAAILALENSRPRGRGLSLPSVRRSELAIAPRKGRRRGPKREEAEALKSLLALLNTCLDWPGSTVSERQLRNSPLLTEERKRLGLPERVSAGTIHNHLQTLARLCRVDRLFDPEPKNQFSTFREGVRERLLRRRPDIEELIAREEERICLPPRSQRVAPPPEPDAFA